jgi:glucose/arabinose dehydrogenase
MNHQDHITRTVLHYKKDPNYIILSRGSNDNLDMQSYLSTTGRAIVKSFDLRTLASGSVNYASGGKVMAYGLRNDVGVAEDRAGNIISVENSADDMKRTVNGQSTDVHQNNPGEPVYNIGTPDAPLGFWGGYPYCFYVWDPTSFRDKTFKTGDNFVQSPNATLTDAWCESKVTKPLLLLPPHTAPLDIKFGLNDTNAYVSLHGSWDRQPPSGYKVLVIPGQYSATGQWSPKSAIAASQTATTDLLWNNDASRCQTGCFTPVGLAFDPTGRFLYVSSDQSNEVFLLKKTS